MPSTFVTNRFLEASQTGRGWEVYEFPVELEPQLTGNTLSVQNQRPVDDARIPSFFGRLLDRKTTKILPSGPASETRNNLPVIPCKNPDRSVISFRVNLPNELKISTEQNEQMLLNLANSASFVSFEIVGTCESIGFQITCPETEKAVVHAQLTNHLPTINFGESEDLIGKHLRFNALNECVSADFGLAREWFLPVPFGKNFTTDSLLTLVASFEQIENEEMACLQILFGRTCQNWRRAAQPILNGQSGKRVFTNLQENTSDIKEKLSYPLLAVGMRFLAQSNSRQRTLLLAKSSTPFFRQFSNPNGNELIPLQSFDGRDESHSRSFLSRQTFRAGALLSVSELASFVHLPSDCVKSWKLHREGNRTKAPPAFALEGNVVLGENCHHDKTQKIKLSDSQRIKHTWLLGASGSGKSWAINNLVEQDMKSGKGLCVIEPHGDLIDNIIVRVPDERLKDVILFDPSDEQFPVAFNFLSAHSELERTLLSSDLVAVFRYFSTSWGDVIETLLHNAILAFLSSTRGGTLVDLRHFLVDSEFRKEFLTTVTDEEIRFFWQNEFPRMGGKPHGPLLTRIDTFLRSRLIRNIVAQKENRLDFRRIMDDRKILLIKLTHGSIGEENSRMLGSLIMAKIYQAALSRQDVPEKQRPDWFIYIDEAHHFIVPSTSLLLSGGRKFHTSLLFSNQETRQTTSRNLTSRNPEILSSLLTNCFTRICFRLDSDAELMAKGFSFFTAEHLKNLGVGEAICRFEQSRYDFNLTTFPLEPVDEETANRRKNAVVELSRRAYGTVKAEVMIENRNISRLPVNSVEDQSSSNRPSPNIPFANGIEESHANLLIHNHIKPNQNFGRAGRHHQELQAVIKRVAETYGFRVEIEQSVLEGSGRVDVSLEKENLRIACEVSVTTTDYEVTNILKCLTAGYDFVVVVLSNQKKLPLLNRKIQAEIPVEHQGKVKAFGLPGLLGFLRELGDPKEPGRERSEKPAGQRLDFTEACEFFDVTASTLYRWVREGRVPFYRPGREYQFDRDELVLIGKHDLSGKRKATVKLSPLNIDKKTPKDKKERDSRYRKLLKLD